jgi:hypothetical protein
MRWYIALFLISAAVWQVSSGRTIDLASATLAIGGTWFVSLFLGD